MTKEECLLDQCKGLDYEEGWCRYHPAHVEDIEACGGKRGCKYAKKNTFSEEMVRKRKAYENSRFGESRIYEGVPF